MVKVRRTTFHYSILLLSLVFFWHAERVSAQQNGIQIEPAVVDVIIEGEEQEKQVDIFLTNNSSEVVEMELYPIDFKQRDEYGGVAFIGQETGSYSYSLSSFLSFESDRITLNPKEKKSISVTVLNRQDLSPGGHYAAVVARMVHEDTSSPVVAPALSSLLLIRKTGGERFNLSLKDVNWPGGVVEFGYPRQMQLLFQNEGNIHLVPHGRVEVRDSFGRLLQKGVLNSAAGKVFPSSRRYIGVELREIQWTFPVSFNTVTLEGQDSLKKTRYAHKESYLYLNPYIFVLPLALFGAVFVRKKLKTKRKS